MISVGIDAGSATTKAILVKSGRSIAHNIRPTAFDFVSAAEMAYKDVLAHAGVDNILPKKPQLFLNKKEGIKSLS